VILLRYVELLERVREVTSKISPEESTSFIEKIKKARRIYVVGAGRSGLVAKAFAMRLVHLRKRTFVVGETIVPAMRQRIDLLVAVSGSGKTKSVVEIAKTARKIGGKIVAVTANKESPLALLANLTVCIPIPKREEKMKSYDAQQLKGPEEGEEVLAPLGSLFELSAMVFFDCLVTELMKELRVSEEGMKRRHTVLE
jgi:6-phospho-3-hexuloisomerase